MCGRGCILSWDVIARQRGGCVHVLCTVYNAARVKRGVPGR